MQQRWPSNLRIVRHGESSGNVAREAADAAGLGRIDIAERDVDVPLSARGEEQAQALGEWLARMPAEERPDVVLTSPYVRARRTAEIVREFGRLDVDVADFVIDAGKVGPPIVGRLVDKGLHNELTGEAYAVIDGTDGRAHHVRFRGVEAFDHAPGIGGIVEVRRFGSPNDERPTLVLANRSDLDLQKQIAAPGSTWLDHRLVEREAMPLAMGGFGREVREAMNARAERLADEGLARRENHRIVLQRNLLATLRRRELDSAGEQLSAETGLPHRAAQAGEHVAGVYRRQLALSSGRFAMIDDGLGFQLVPWSREIEKKLGQHISGVAKASGGIDWSLGRKRDLGI